jgi:hypothetical protein
MGCDIHLWAEVRKDGQWEKVGRIWPNSRWTEGNTIEDEPEQGYYWGPMTDQPYQGGRGYGLFGILAGVRARDMVSLGKPRGIPPDASTEYRRLAERSTDWHSHSWWTVAELIAWPCWQMPAGFEKDMDDPVWRKQYALHMEAGKRKAEMTEEEKRAGSEAFGELVDRIPQRIWTAADYAGPFYRETIPRLLDLGAPEDVRIVFFFDN